MLIRSKNKSGIHEATNIIINDNNEIVKIFSDDVYFLLGRYESQEQCLDVLQYIYNCISSGYTIIDMPESNFRINTKPIDQTMNRILPWSVVVKLNKCKIYTMDELIAKQDYVYSLKGIGPKTTKIIKESIKKYKGGN